MAQYSPLNDLWIAIASFVSLIFRTTKPSRSLKQSGNRLQKQALGVRWTPGACTCIPSEPGLGLQGCRMGSPPAIAKGSSSLTYFISPFVKRPRGTHLKNSADGPEEAERSMTSTEAPARARISAAAEPAGPPPMMQGLANLHE
jgi:hypothetical protein